MRLSTSTCIYFNRPDGTKASILDSIALCSQAGYKVMDMNFHDCSVFKTPFWNDNWEKWMHKIKDHAHKYTIEFSQGHSHFYNYCDSTIPNKDDLDEKIRRGILGAEILGIKWLVIHAASDWSSVEMVKSSKAKSIEYFKPLCEFAAKHNVGIAIENLWEANISPQRRYTTTAEELVDLVEALPYDNIGICWDFEHSAIMQQDPLQALQYVGKYLKATHISDFIDKTNDHILPFQGHTNWDEVMQSLANIDYQGDFTYEIHRYTLNTPDELVSTALRYSVEVGQYLLNIYEQKKRKKHYE